MVDARERMERDLVLAPGEYAFISDQTKGNINVYTGPNKASLSQTDQPVAFDPQSKRFVRCELSESIRCFAIAPEGWYIALKNPSVASDVKGDDGHPTPGTTNNSFKLNIGKKINIKGPASFALWPGQMARVIQGHRLKSNQFLLARVYDDEAAKHDELFKDVSAIGQLLIIKGIEVSFFIPPTGIEVVPDENGEFVREAVSLERLEYCLLLDQNGKKRYVKGPDVVFPKPTEEFISSQNDDGVSVRKFRAIELSPTSGIYVKVIESYTDEDSGTAYKQGDELFITGNERRIYFPREEHAIIKYSGQQVHHGIALPKGEGRYVLDRDKGEISIKKGPAIFLPDPIKQVVVKRVLSQDQCSLMFPGNSEALSHNATLSARMEEQKLEQKTKGLVARGVHPAAMAAAAYCCDMEMSAQNLAITGFLGDEFARKNEYTKPRTITLNTKYDGVVTISPWTGYAVLVVGKAGSREVVVGPATRMLEYDEDLQVLTLSTGRPKGSKPVLRTVYLQIENNRVSDVIDVETKDFTKVQLTVSYRVRFVGEKEKWFAVSNYTKLLTEHMRSKLRRAAIHHNIEEFYMNAPDIIRDVVLGKAAGEKERPGTTFQENNMQIYDVEILNVHLLDPKIQQLLEGAQQEGITQVVQIARARRGVETICKTEEFKRQEMDAKSFSAAHTQSLVRVEIEESIKTDVEKAKAEEARVHQAIGTEELRCKLGEIPLVLEKKKADMALAIERERVSITISSLEAEAVVLAKKMTAVSPHLIQALQGFGDRVTLQNLATALSPFGIIDMLRGKSIVESVGRLVKGTSLSDALPPHDDGGGNGKSLGARR